MIADPNAHYRELAINYLQQKKASETAICSSFGCGKKLTIQEQLYGKKCIQCSKEKKIDITKAIRF